MKIWLIAENWPPRRGGIENYLTHIAQLLGESGHEVVVMAPLMGDPNESESHQPTPRLWPTSPNVPNVTIVRRRFFWPVVAPAWLPLFVFLYWSAKRERPDVILCGKGLFEGLLGYYLGKHLKIPYMVFTYAMEIAAWSSRSKLRRKLQRVMRGARWVAYINDVTKKSLLDMGAVPEKLVKLAPAVDDRFLRDMAPSLVTATLSHYGLRQPYLLSVGRIITRKGFDTLIEAFSHLDQTQYGALKLVIVGDGPDRTRLDRLVADNYMQTSVVFLKEVEDRHLPALYKGAEFFAMTPRDVEGDIEGFGIVYLEAAAVGRATIGTRSGGVPHAVIDGLTGLLVAPGDVSDLKEALTRLLSDREWRQRLGEAGRARVHKEFRWPERLLTIQRLL